MAAPDRPSRRGGPRRSLALLVALAAAGVAPPALGQSGTAARPVVLSGALADEDARPLAHYPVQACLATTCFFGETAADGRFRFDLRLPVPTRLAIKTLEEADAIPHRAAALAPVLVDGRPGIDAGTVYVLDLPDTPARLTGGGQVVDAGDGLSLSLPAAGLRPPAGKALTGVAARRLRPALIPRYDLPAGERVLAVYVFQPFGATSSSPVGVRIASDLDAGSRVRFRTIDELDGSFSEPAVGAATGTHLATAPGAGISELTHLVITR